MAGSPPAALAEDTQAVGIVHHDSGAVLPRQADDLRQVGDLAGHGEDAVCHNQDAALGAVGRQQTLQVLHIVMLKRIHPGEGQLAAVVNAGVILFVAEDIVAVPGNGADGAQVGLKARREGHCRVLMQEIGQLRLQLQMQLQRAV